ncbi:MAG: hypothetical protein AB1726_02520 [Planctomycetota bacterium]
MNRFVTGALALAAAGSAAYAEPATSDWLELDSELSTLASSTTATGDYTNLKVLLRGGYVYSGDELAVGDDDGSISGVRFWDVAVAGGTQVGDVGVRLGFDFARQNWFYSKSFDGLEWTPTLEDAYATWKCGEVDVIAGQYKPHVTRTGFTDPEYLFFLERSAMGSLYDWYDAGIGARGSFGDFSWNVDVMNGAGDEIYFGDYRGGISSGHIYILRALWNFGRTVGGYEMAPEDAYGAGDDPTGTIGVWYVMDDIWNGWDTDTYGIDGQGTFGQFGWGFEVESRDDDAGEHLTAPGWNSLYWPLLFGGDSTPWMVYGTWQVNEEWGVGLRYEDLDNSGPLWTDGPEGGDDTVLTLGVNRYDVGHNGKIGASVAMIDSSDNEYWDGYDFGSTTVFQVGYTYGASR